MKYGHREIATALLVTSIIGLLIVSVMYVQAELALREVNVRNTDMIQQIDSLSKKNEDLIRQRDHMEDLTEDAYDRLYERGCM